MAYTPKHRRPAPVNAPAIIVSSAPAPVATIYAGPRFAPAAAPVVDVISAAPVAPMPTIVSTRPNTRPSNGNGNVSVKKREGGAIRDAHNQWATRPADEAVHSFDELLERTGKVRRTSAEVEPQKWSDLAVEVRGNELALTGPRGGGLLNHWSMTRLAHVASAPAEYIATLPAELAARCLTHGLENQTKRTGSAAMLVTGANIRALTSERYERVWDHEIATLAHQLHTRGTWGACEAFRSASSQRVSHAWGDSKPLPLGWVGDRSSFIALADYEGGITVNGSKLARFALLSNSEVGAASLKIVFGLMDFACANFILWGCQQVTEVSVRHVGSVRDTFARMTAPMSHRLESGERDTFTRALAQAGRTLIADTQDEVLARTSYVTKIPQGVIADAWQRAEATPRYGDPRTVWGMLSGLTEASQHATEYADRRIAIDESAAKLMTLI